jgi:hypothetical protein
MFFYHKGHHLPKQHPSCPARPLGIYIACSFASTPDGPAFLSWNLL